MECRANSDPRAVYNEAYAAASAAMKDYLVRIGSEPMYCGFAWVKIKPAKGGFVNYCKKNNLGSVAYNGGYQIWKPGGWPSSAEVGFQIYGQSMDVNEEGSRAFAKVLRDNGLEAYMECRAD